MSAGAALIAMLVCLGLAALARANAKAWGRRGSEKQAVTAYLRSAAYVGMTLAFGIAAVWATIF